MAEEELDRAQVSCLSVDLSYLCPTQRMRAVKRAVETRSLRPTANDPSVVAA